MVTSSNPFRSTGPIREEKAFFDRERELRLVLEALARGQSIQVYGPRRRGKTSLLFAVQRDLAEQGRRSLYLTLELFPTAAAFWQNLAQEAGLDAWNPATPDYPALGEALAEKRVVLLVDELDRAIADPEGYPDDFFVALRGLEIGHAIPFVVAVKQALGTYPRFHGGPTSPFGNTFLPLPLSPFDEEVARALLKPLAKRAQAAGWPEDWVQQVHRKAQGEPWKLQRFGERLWEVEPLPSWEEALALWQEALQEEAAVSRSRLSPEPPDRDEAPRAESAIPRPWYLTPAFLGFLLMLASALWLLGLLWGSLLLGGIAFVLFGVLFVLVWRVLGQ